ncbi:MAG: nucleotidyltransferase family protein [Dehalococcoidia bacterium]
MSGPTLEEIRLRRAEILRVATEHGAANLRVFGSVARGEADADSDVDFLVDLQPELLGFDYFACRKQLSNELGAILGHSVDVVRLRGPFSPQGEKMAAAIQREAMPL